MMGPIVMKRKSTQKHKHSVRNAGEIAECLGKVTRYIIFIHVFGGYGTTSAVFDQGELSMLGLTGKSKASPEAADVFLKKDSITDKIKEAAFNLLYFAISWKRFRYFIHSPLFKIHENDIGSACIYKRKITSHYQGGMLHFHCIYQESSSSRTNLST